MLYPRCALIALGADDAIVANLTVAVEWPELAVLPLRFQDRSQQRLLRRISGREPRSLNALFSVKTAPVSSAHSKTSRRFLAGPRAIPDRSEDFAAPVVCEGGGKAT